MEWLQRTLLEWEYQPATPSGAGPAVGGKALQHTGMISQYTLDAFCQRSQQLFESADFVASLREAHKAGHNVADLISQRQAAIFEQLGVKGEFGVNCLARVKAAYGHNPDTMRKFYMFAQREELLMDEVELPPEQLVQRQALFKQQEALAARLQNMTTEERRQLLMQQQQMMQHLHEMSDVERREFLNESKLAASTIMQEMGGLSHPI
mmetsp:Transcript_18972/g.48697  ORF Transcript_18972/g.48697 Transcript_18972/m.48697 type:complete len:208 (+) Transcript_18972:272-895(+)